ncbi:MAG: orotidine-5'-phosphate decarboxylase [Gammaproteobacteria bacterium]|nr:orotidine-5'-phosphate decarboxylase [Gammaproteobacteria bacterium]
MIQRPKFYELLTEAWKESRSFLCVGIDPSIEMFPTNHELRHGGFLDFCTSIVDAVSEYVCALKMNHAHFASSGHEPELESLIDYIHETNPGIPVILDAKRGDVDSTAAKYAKESFERYSADAVTVNPYLGWDTLEPFIKYERRGVVVLCKTSNPGSAWLQDHPKESPMYLRIAERVQQQANPNLMLVVGATHENSLSQVRQIAPDVTFLVPGVGAQGGNAENVMKLGKRSDGLGLIINCSRSVIAQDRETFDYFGKVASAAKSLSESLSIRVN